MKKKLFGIGMIVMLLLSQVVCVSAKSKQTNLWPAGDSDMWYMISPASQTKVQALRLSDPLAADTVNQINDGEESVSMIGNQQQELADQLKNARMLTPILNVAPVNGGVKTEEGDYLLQVSFPGLTSKISDLCVLYYNAVQKIWQIITPSAIDWDNKVVTMKMKDVSDLSFMTMVAKAEVGDESNDAEDDNTDTTDTTDNANTSDNNSDDSNANDTSTDGNQTSDTNAGDANNTDSTGNDAGSTDTVSGESSTQTSTSTVTATSASAASGSVTGESPRTGVDSNWMWYVCAAGVLLAASAAAFRKSEQQ